MKIILEKHHLVTAQLAGFLKDRNAVDDLWSKLTQICDASPSQSTTSNDTKTEERYDLPALRGNLQTLPFSTILSSKIITIVCSLENGLPTSKIILEKISQLDTSVKPQLIDSLDYLDIETKVAASTGLVVLLTADALKHPHIEFSMLCAKRYFPVTSQVILVHDATSCFFPGLDEQPVSVREFFSEKAVTFLPCNVTLYMIFNGYQGYAKKGAEEILQKYDQEMVALESSFKNKQSAASALFARIAKQSTTPDATEIALEDFQKAFSSVCVDLDDETVKRLVIQMDVNQDRMIDNDEFCKLIIQNEETLNKYLEYETIEEEHEDLWTRVFLSHKRSTGQGIAGRLYEGLRYMYKVFLDSEAKFKIHNLKEIVANTQVFIFILTAGIFQSRWCREELESAIEQNKRIIIVRELGFQFPDPIPNEWEKCREVLKSSELIWMAEYNDTCCEALLELIGFPDNVFIPEQKYLKENPNIITDSTITELDFDSKTWLSEKLLYKITENKENITSLNLNYCYFTTDEVLEYLAKYKLVKLALCDCINITDVGLSHIASINTLEYLDLSVCRGIKDDGVIEIVRKNNKLRHLNLASCNSITDESILEIAKQKLPLQYFNVSETDVTDAGIIALVQNNIQLEHLEIACEKITDASIFAIAHIPLQHLNVSNSMITDVGIIELAKHNMPLQTLNLEKTKITDASLVGLVQYKIPLRVLDVSSTEITDEGLVQIAQLPLKELAIFYCESITEAGKEPLKEIVKE